MIYEAPHRKLKIYEAPHRKLKIYEAPHRKLKIYEAPRRKLKIQEAPHRKPKIYEAPHRKLKIEQHPPYYKSTNISHLNICISIKRKKKIINQPSIYNVSSYLNINKQDTQKGRTLNIHNNDCKNSVVSERVRFCLHLK